MTYGLHPHQPISCPASVTGDAGIFFLTLINTLFTNQCQLGNKNDYPVDAAPSLQENDVFDYIVVGGGTSGSIVASKLAETTHDRILLLEAGGYPSPTSDIPALHLSLQRTIEDWQFHTERSDTSCLGFKNGQCYWPSGKTLGGSSSINLMTYLKGSKQSYNSWAESGNIGWSFKEVDKYFRKSEKLEAPDLIASKFYNLTGSLPLTRNRLHQPLRTTIIDAVKKLGYKITSHEAGSSFFEALQTINQGVRKNTAKVFLANHESLPNLKVATECLVEKILIDKETKEANGVRVNVAGNTIDLYADKEVIISAGAINSPKLLMLSGVGPHKHLINHGIEIIHDLNVGQNLKDHLMYPLFAVKLNKNAVKYSNQDPTEELFKYFSKREGVFSNTGVSNIMGLINTKKHSGEPNIKFSYLFIPHQDSYTLSQFKRIYNFEDAILNSLVEANKHSHVLIFYITLLDAKSKGRIMLRSRNPHEKPLIYSEYLTEQTDLETMLAGIKIAEKFLETPSFKNLSAELVDIDIPNCRKYKFRSDDYWRCSIRNIATTGYAPYGSCQMGLSFDPFAVVDPLLRVHGLSKLRIVDASVIPSTTRGDLGATVMMIGQKGAQMILNGFQVDRHNN